MRRDRRPRLSGFSLVEMIAALAIFSGGVLALMEVLTTCLQSTSSSLSYTRAVHLAQQTVEETIAERDLTPGTDSGDFGLAFPGYSWMREIEETEQTGLKRLQVAVTWKERGRDKQFVLTTFAADRR